MATTIMFILFLGLAFLSVPMAVAIGIGVLGAIFSGNAIDMSFFLRAMANSVDSFTLTAVPFFILAGHIMSEVGISEGLFNAANAMFGRVKGGVMIVSVVSCAVFGAVSGSSYAAVAAIGLIALPELRRQNVSLGMSTALLATAGGLGQMIPPSAGLVIYGSLNNVSISELFIAELLPGIFMAFCFSAFCFIYGRKHNIVAKNVEQFDTLGKKLKVIWRSKWALLLPVIMLGSIYTGLATPTESAVISVVYAIVYGLLNKKSGFKISDLISMLKKSVLTTSSTLFILACSSGLSKIITLEQIPQKFADFMASNVSSAFGCMAILTVIVIFLGMFVDGIAINTILGPILCGVAKQFGIDPVYFGVVFLFNMTFGLITPPLGGNLFVAMQICGARYEEVTRNILPWIVVMLIGLIVITCIPQLSLWLPGLMNG